MPIIFKYKFTEVNVYCAISRTLKLIKVKVRFFKQFFHSPFLSLSRNHILLSVSMNITTPDISSYKVFTFCNGLFHIEKYPEN